MKKEICICWFRRDLRLNDHAAFYYALTSGYPVLPIFIFDPKILNKLSDKEDKRLVFIHEELLKLNSELNKCGSAFIIKHDTVISVFKNLLKSYNVKAVYLNHDYEPEAIVRDEELRQYLYNSGIELYTFKDQVIFEKSDIMKSNGSPYTVFTPYAKRWKEKYSTLATIEYPSQNHLSGCLNIENQTIPSLEDIGFNKVLFDYPKFNISEELIRNYSETRNIPSEQGTSLISVYLRFGVISIRHLVNLAIRWNETWLNELIWREFFMMILYHFPHVVENSFKKKYDQIQWRNNEFEFQAWCRGETGYPMVDAGMRQLNESGLMHNRVRMITAGFLCKHLLIDWRWGEAYFAKKLLDYELSSNNGNWQWAAGTGCDAAPYFRIFNPNSQLLKFDPKKIYIRYWIKDFDSNYLSLNPIVDHEFARKRALELYRNTLTESYK